MVLIGVVGRVAVEWWHELLLAVPSLRHQVLLSRLDRRLGGRCVGILFGDEHLRMGRWLRIFYRLSRIVRKVRMHGHFLRILFTVIHDCSFAYRMLTKWVVLRYFAITINLWLFRGVAVIIVA